MNSTYDINSLTEEVSRARESYYTFNGAEWLRLALGLSALSDAFCANNEFDKAADCHKEYNDIMSRFQEAPSSLVFITKEPGGLLDDYAHILMLAERESESRRNLSEGESPIRYAKTVFALCEYLWPSIQNNRTPLKKERLKWAKLKYKEALDVLLPLFDSKEGQDTDSELLYLKIVFMLKYSDCLLSMGDISSALTYSKLAVYFIASNIEIVNPRLLDWKHIASLCRAQINKD